LLLTLGKFPNTIKKTHKRHYETKEVLRELYLFRKALCQNKRQIRANRLRTLREQSGSAEKAEEVSPHKKLQAVHRLIIYK